MSWAEQAAPPSTILSIIDALADYTKVTGIDLSENPFAAAIERSNSPEAILQLLHEREKAFKEYREGNRRLISCLRPVVNVIQAFSGILGEAVTLVSTKPHMTTSDSFNVILLGPLSTSEGFVCWDRCSASCASLEYALHLVPL
jgi:STAND-like protein